MNRSVLIFLSLSALTIAGAFGLLNVMVKSPSPEISIAEKKKLKFTGRMKAYSVVLLLLIGIEGALLATRSDYDATVLRAKGMLYQERANEQVSNLYTIKLVNKTRHATRGCAESAAKKYGYRTETESAEDYPFAEACLSGREVFAESLKRF